MFSSVCEGSDIGIWGMSLAQAWENFAELMRSSVCVAVVTLGHEPHASNVSSRLAGFHCISQG